MLLHKRHYVHHDLIKIFITNHIFILPILYCVYQIMTLINIHYIYIHIKSSHPNSEVIVSVNRLYYNTIINLLPIFYKTKSSYSLCNLPHAFPNLTVASLTDRFCASITSWIIGTKSRWSWGISGAVLKCENIVENINAIKIVIHITLSS